MTIKDCLFYVLTAYQDVSLEYIARLVIAWLKKYMLRKENIQNSARKSCASGPMVYLYLPVVIKSEKFFKWQILSQRVILKQSVEVGILSRYISVLGDTIS